MNKRVQTFCCIFIGMLMPVILCAQLDPLKLKSSIIFEGNDSAAFRDPLPFYNNGVLYLFFTLTEIETDGKVYMYTALSTTKDLFHWTKIQKITERNQQLNFSSPGSIVRYQGEWWMCLQTYPRPAYTVRDLPLYGNENARLYFIRSKDLITWTKPALIKVKGDTVVEKNMGRMIDPFLLEDKKDKGKWWIFYKQHGASRAYSYDLIHWNDMGNEAAGENVCIIQYNHGYRMYHSLENGIGVKTSNNLLNWVDQPTVIFLGQDQWQWAKGRITAGYVLELSPKINPFKYLMFFHGSGPRKETNGDFDRNASIGLAWTNEIDHWFWK